MSIRKRLASNSAKISTEVNLSDGYYIHYIVTIKDEELFNKVKTYLDDHDHIIDEIYNNYIELHLEEEQTKAIGDILDLNLLSDFNTEFKKSLKEDKVHAREILVDDILENYGPDYSNDKIYKDLYWDQETSSTENNDKVADYMINHENFSEMLQWGQVSTRFINVK
jgi:hypothetical protein